MIETFFSLLFQVFFILIIIRVIMSWLPMFGMNLSPYNPFVNAIHQATEPILSPIRRLIPPLGGTIDLSPLIAIIVIQILMGLVSGSD